MSLDLWVSKKKSTKLWMWYEDSLVKTEENEKKKKIHSGIEEAG